MYTHVVQAALLGLPRPPYFKGTRGGVPYRWYMPPQERLFEWQSDMILLNTMPRRSGKLTGLPVGTSDSSGFWTGFLVGQIF